VCTKNRVKRPEGYEPPSGNRWVSGQEIGPAMKHDDSVYGALLRRPRRPYDFLSGRMGEVGGVRPHSDIRLIGPRHEYIPEDQCRWVNALALRDHSALI
jgi:hypothetical protein